jgi:predicted nucleic acid-binding protein
MVYADTSFFLSSYLEDVHSKTANDLVRSREVVCFTPFHHAEIAHALGQQVFFKHLTTAEADDVYRDLADDRNAGVWANYDFPEKAFEVCARLARRHGAKLGVRTLDSLHVACALELNAEQFWTFDERQAKLARAEGLKTPQARV